MLEQEVLRGIGTGGFGPWRPTVVVQIHVRVVLDMTAHGAIEIPEPVRAQLVAARAPELLVAFFDEA